jgi:hypothetical protein
MVINRKVLMLLIVVLTASGLYARQPVTENLVLITLDGYRWQELFSGVDSILMETVEYTRNPDEIRQRFWSQDPLERRMKLNPFFWGVLAAHGQLYGNRKFDNRVDCSNSMWFSYPGYNEILSGYADDARITSNNKINNPNVTVLEYLNQQPKLKGKVAAFGSWDVFPYIINRERSGIPVNAGFELALGNKLSDREKFLNELQLQIPSPWSSVRLDAFTHHYAMAYLKKNKPRVIYIAYGETDDFAHDGNYSAYLKSAWQTNRFIEDIWNFVQATPGYSNKTTMIITTDHGRGEMPLESWRHHGKDVEGAGQVWLAVMGPETDARGEVNESMQLFQHQIAQTVAAFLRVHFAPAHPTGNVISSAISSVTR